MEDEREKGNHVQKNAIRYQVRNPVQWLVQDLTVISKLRAIVAYSSAE
jgi:hypothetical protein